MSVVIIKAFVIIIVNNAVRMNNAIKNICKVMLQKTIFTNLLRGNVLTKITRKKVDLHRKSMRRDHGHRKEPKRHTVYERTPGK